MVMIPTEERTGQPYKNVTGETVKVYPTRVDADSSIDYYEISGVTRKGTGEKLYLPADRGIVG
jgi:hypothetical protein